MPTTDERALTALALRAGQGLTYAAIGAQVGGVTASRASQLASRGYRLFDRRMGFIAQQLNGRAEPPYDHEEHWATRCATLRCRPRRP